MTYPPQQPGPYGQQNPWGQPPQGGFPPQQQPPSQQPPWLSGDPGGGFPSWDQEPKKSKGPMIAVVVIVALLVLGGGGFGVWMLVNKDKDDPEPTGGGGGGGGDDARAVAEKYVEELQTTVNTEISDIELSGMEPLTCADDFERMEKEIREVQDNGDLEGGQPGSIKIGMEDFEASEEKASFTLTQKIDEKDAPSRDMTMAKEEGDWKVCGLYGSNSPDDDPTEESSPTDDPTDDPPASNGEIPNPIPTT